MKKYDYLVVNGCSYTNGLGCDNLMSDRFSKLLSDKLNCIEVNISMNGGSNDRIIRTTYDYIKSLTGDFKSKKNVLFIFGLSGITRKDVWVNWPKKDVEGRYCQFNFAHRKLKNGMGFARKLDLTEKNISSKDSIKFFELYLKHFFDESETNRRTFQQLDMLQSFIKDKIPNGDMILFSSLCHGINWKMKNKFNWFEFGKHETWDDFIQTKSQNLRNIGHPNTEAHKLMSEDLYQYIKDEL